MANKSIKKKKKKTQQQKNDAARNGAIKSEQEKLIPQDTKKQKKPKKEKPPRPDIGKYVSVLSKEDRDSRQKKKTIFQLVGVFLFAANLFNPANISNLPKAAGSLFVAFNFVVVIVAVYISFQGFRKHLIREEIDANDAPKKGFKKTTFILFDVFMILFFLLVVEQSVIIYYARDIFAYIGELIMVASAISIVLARDILYKANKDAIFVPPLSFKNNISDESNEFYENFSENTSEIKENSEVESLPLKDEIDNKKIDNNNNNDNDNDNNNSGDDVFSASNEW